MTVEATLVKEPETRTGERPWPPPQGEWAYEDWLRLPDDGWQYEVIKGVLYMTPAPTPRHQRISGNLGFQMLAFVRARQLGEVYDAPIDVYLPGQETPVQPDLIFVTQDRLHIVDLDDAVHGAPDLIVEILSPSDWLKDRKVKFALYQETGVREYWIVDPRTRTIEVYVLRGGRYDLIGQWGDEETARSEVLARLEVAVGEVIPR